MQNIASNIEFLLDRTTDCCEFDIEGQRETVFFSEKIRSRKKMAGENSTQLPIAILSKTETHGPRCKDASSGKTRPKHLLESIRSEFIEVSGIIEQLHHYFELPLLIILAQIPLQDIALFLALGGMNEFIGSDQFIILVFYFSLQLLQLHNFLNSQTRYEKLVSFGH